MPVKAATMWASSAVIMGATYMTAKPKGGKVDYNKCSGPNGQRGIPQTRSWIMNTAFGSNKNK